MKSKGSTKEASDWKKRIIEHLNSQGYTREDIGKMMGLHHSTVIHHLKRGESNYGTVEKVSIRDIINVRYRGRWIRGQSPAFSIRYNSV